ncbi:bacillithiol biosynthesis deacetylase BshB1 [bacterium A37T11]|nr:bacillithiol biosynthesis deacetylase BshB1 [bacterium A37T11]
MVNKLDLLVITVHPDDAELCCGGTIAKHIALGKKVGIVDLTRGELGTRGSAEIRDEEAEEAARLLGISLRLNLGMRDGFFRNDEAHQLEVIRIIRQFRPEIVISNATVDRHPDHIRAGDLLNDAVFLSGLRKIETHFESVIQEPHRPRLLLQSIQDTYVKPDIVLDVTDYWDTKIAAIRAYKSQFFHEEYEADEPQTYISTPQFLEIVKSRGLEYGKYIGVQYAEGFTCRRIFGVENLFNLK